MITDLETINFAKKRVRTECDYTLKKEGKISRDRILKEVKKEFNEKLDFQNLFIKIISGLLAGVGIIFLA